MSQKWVVRDGQGTELAVIEASKDHKISVRMPVPVLMTADQVDVFRGFLGLAAGTARGEDQTDA